MAKRHHYLPRFLLARFRSRPSDKPFVWVYRRGAAPREDSITNVALEKYFHGTPQEAQLEEKLSPREGDYAELLRELDVSAPTNVELINEFVTHLILRTAAVRYGVLETLTDGLQLLEEAFSSEQYQPTLRDLAARHALMQPALAVRLLRLSDGDLLRAADRVYAQSRTINMADLVKQFFGVAKENVDFQKVAKNAHIRGLEEKVGKWTRMDLLQGMAWRVIDYPAGAIVLGDLGPIARASQSAPFEAPITLGKDFEEVVCPISSNSVLFGSRNAESQAPDGALINLASVELSRDFFISARNSGVEQSYHHRLGTRSSLLSEDEARQIIQNALARPDI